MMISKSRFHLFFCLLGLLHHTAFSQKVRYSGDKNKYHHKTGVTELIGNAKLRRDSSYLRGSKITFHSKQKYAIATGEVFFEDKKKKLRYEGNWLRYDYDKKKIQALNRPSLYDDKYKLTLIADEIRGDLETDISKAFSNVHIIDRRGKDQVDIFGDLGTYHERESIAIMEKNSRIETKGLRGEADTMIYFQKKKLIKMNGLDDD